MNRNNIIYTWQINRNPFIDQPELIDYIWGSKVGQVWDQELSATDTDPVNFKIYPNPTKDRIYISGIKSDTKVEVFSMDGRNVLMQNLGGDGYFNLSSEFRLARGIYVLRLNGQGKSLVKKVVVE